MNIDVPEQTRVSAHLAFGHLASTVVVVTTVDGDHPRGMTVSSMCTLSIDTPRLLVSFAAHSGTYAAVRRRGELAINVLHESQAPLATRFASRFDTAKFDDVDHALVSGLPVLAGAVAVFGCFVETTFQAGDHDLLVAGVNWASHEPEGPLLRYRHSYRRIGGEA